jgi:SAM-dependent methyltransferase
MPNVTFSFGENWQSYQRSMDDESVRGAIADTRAWLADDMVQQRSVLDIGSGSGIHSLAFHRRGAARVESFDYDPKSVEATHALWKAEGAPENWRVQHGSILDPEFVAKLGTGFDIVYSWGVLHHTGALWKAVGNALSLVRPGGSCWISLYAKGPHYPRDLALKQRYNRRGRFGKWLMQRWFIGRVMLYRARHGLNPFAWNERKVRGMDTWHDIVDWLGGLPYEVASIDEVVAYAAERGFALRKLATALEGSCHVFLFSRDLPAYGSS